MAARQPASGQRLSRRRLLQSAGVAAAVGAATGVASLTRESDSRPAIVLLLLSDDQRADSVILEGGDGLATPALQRLATDGTHIADAFVTSSICPVSRASIITGQHVAKHGIVDFSTPLSRVAEQQSLPGLLAEHGWTTAFVGKWGLGGDLPGSLFDVFEGFAGQGEYLVADSRDHLTERLTDTAIGIIRERGEDRLFLMLSYKAPHVQDAIKDASAYVFDDEYDDRYADLRFTPPDDSDFADLPPFLQNSEGRVRYLMRMSPASAYQRALQGYHRLVAGLDDSVAAIVAELRQLGAYDNSMIVFTSDNGALLGEHGLAGKWLGYEASIRVPMILKPAGRSPVSVPSGPALNIDVAPTILEACDIEIPAAMQGRPLLQSTERPTPPRNDWYFDSGFREHELVPYSIGVRSPRWKYLRYPDLDPPYEQLFDLEADPQELDNLAASRRHEDTLNVLRDRCDVLAMQARGAEE